jgi:hypothetical protein
MNTTIFITRNPARPEPAPRPDLDDYADPVERALAVIRSNGNH